MEEISYLEEQLSINIDLLEIAKDYCEFHQDKSSNIGNLLSLIEIILHNDKAMITKLDTINMN